MTSPDAITNILNEQLNGYKVLLRLLQRERTCLLDFNADGIEGLLKEKDTVMMKLRLLEEERVRLTKAYSGDNITLLKLSELTGNKTFLEMRSKLISLLQGVEELNEFNRVLMDRSLNYIRTNVKFIDALGLKGAPAKKGSLLSMET